MANIKLRSAVVAHGIQAVLRDKRLEASAREVVQSVAIRIAGDEGEIVEVACGESNLEGIVIGDVRTRHLIDVVEDREIANSTEDRQGIRSACARRFPRANSD